MKHEAIVKGTQDSLQNTLQLVLPKENTVTCIFTDASENFWTSIVTQTPTIDSPKVIQDQAHKPMIFLGGQFTG